jgi:hypothetical protein
MPHIHIGLFPYRTAAERAIAELENSGFDADHAGVVRRDPAEVRGGPDLSRMRPQPAAAPQTKSRPMRSPHSGASSHAAAPW